MNNKKLRKMLIDKETNITELAKATKVTRVQVSRIVAGTSKGSLKWWRNAAEFLEVELTEIIE